MMQIVVFSVVLNLINIYSILRYFVCNKLTGFIVITTNNVIT